ncbi:MAG TPA: hypothetical protein VEJ63_16680 [Planctomycetota bacterium]|nr:hypothetical protein [Planctomycetota bacterium]
MISCRDFIPAYSELFKFLEQKGGPKEVNDFWCVLSDKFLGNLDDLVTKNGIKGCWMYWSHTLNEEAADFTMELNEEEGWFRIILHECPSMKRLIDTKHIEPYHDYCKHCDVLYRRVFDRHGLQTDNNLSTCREAKCSALIRTKEAVAKGLPLDAATRKP